MDRIEEKLDEIITLLQENKKVQTKLEHHIDFIEGTYEQLHTPLTYIRNMVSRLTGTSSVQQLPHVND